MKKQLSLFREIIVDNFAGGGGASSGIEMATGLNVDIAINHDPAAIAMHKANHPDTEHYCESVWDVDPKKVVDGRRVGLCWLSPDCKHFSKAKGGKPVSKNVRGLAWIAVKWAIAVRPRVIILENVEEFKTWGPLTEDGYPDEKQKGKTFNSFIKSLKALGYEVDFRELRACDYGAPTIRKRFFMIARCDGRPITWPEPTHGDPRELNVQLGLKKPWRTASEIIDWSIPCQSIFDRKKALAENTMKRIARGIQKFVIDNPNPFIVDESANFLISYHSETTDKEVRGLELTGPIHTLDTSNRFGLVAAYLEKYVQEENYERIGSDKTPNRTRCSGDKTERRDMEKSKNHMDRENNSNNSKESRTSTEEWLPWNKSMCEQQAIFSSFPQSSMDNDVWGNPEWNGHQSQRWEETQQFSGEFGNCNEGRKYSSCISNRTTREKRTCFEGSPGGEKTKENGILLFEDSERIRNIADNSIQGGNGQIMAFLTKFYGSDTGQTLTEPLHTVTTKDRFGLVTVEGQDYQIIDIGMRMLQPRELFNAQGFSPNYIIDRDYTGNKYPKTEQVARCGNAVPPPFAEALVRTNLPEMCESKKEMII